MKLSVENKYIFDKLLESDENLTSHDHLQMANTLMCTAAHIRKRISFIKSLSSYQEELRIKRRQTKLDQISEI